MSAIVPEDQRFLPEVGDLTTAKNPPTRVYVRAHANVFGLTQGEYGWIPNGEEAVEAAAQGLVSFAPEPDEEPAPTEPALVPLTYW